MTDGSRPRSENCIRGRCVAVVYNLKSRLSPLSVISLIRRTLLPVSTLIRLCGCGDVLCVHAVSWSDSQEPGAPEKLPDSKAGSCTHCS